jgi:small subunit ribosomal protein S7
MAYKRFTKSAEQIAPDSKFGSVLVTKFVNCLMYDGKKSTAYRVFCDAMEIVSKRIKDTPPVEVFETALNRVKPNIEVRSRRVGGSNYQVPMQVSRKRQQSLAIRWMLGSIRTSRRTSGKSTSALLAQEICDAFKGEGTAMKKREDVHRMAEANKAFAHFAW